jgi:small subunit ribosomal protein S9
MAEKKTFYLGTGRRKTAVARVRVADGKGKVEINGRPLDAYFTEDKDRAFVMGPLVVTEQAARLDVTVKVHGGGITGQAGAIGQGLARAIKTMFSPAEERKSVTMGNVTMVRSRNVQTKDRDRPAAAPAPAPSANGEAAPADDAGPTGLVKRLRDSGFLTRDSRMKERKKYGLRGARRGTQFSKR